MYPFIPIGPIALPTAPFIFLLGIWLALTVVERAADRLQIEREVVYAAGLVGVVSALIGARLTFVFFYLDAFVQAPLTIVWPLGSGFNLWGGILFGCLAIFFYVRWKDASLGDVADALTPGAAVLLIALSLGDWLGGPGYGTPAAFELWDRHPVQLYEIAVFALALVVWWWAAPQRPFPGALALITIAVVSAGIVFIAPYRGNNLIGGDNWIGLQLLAFVLMQVALVILTALAPEEAEDANVQTK